MLINSKYAKNIIIFHLVLLMAIAMGARKQFILNPYEDFEPMPQIFTALSPSDTNGSIHPIYTKNFYTPPALELVPHAILFNPWFHVFSVITFWVLIIGGVFILIKKSGLTIYQSMAITLFTLFVGNLLTQELLGISLLGPAPYVGYRYYSIRIFVIPLSILALIFMFNRRFGLAGILVGLATFFHIKFGFRFFGLLFLSLWLWKSWGSQKFGQSQNDLNWKNIFMFAMNWGILFLITFWHIQSSMNFFDSLNLPQSQPAFSQLAWLIKNEPDDWLISYHFKEDRQFYGFLFMAITTGVFCETIISLSTSSKMRKFALVWEIATFISVFYWCVGFILESFLIDFIPLNIAHSLILTRFWDLIWVVVIGFWINLFLVVTVVGQKILTKLFNHESLAENFVFHMAIALFISINILIFLKNKGGEWEKVSQVKSGKLPVLKVVDYVQICDGTTSEYEETFKRAVNAIQAKDEIEFKKASLRLNKIYDDLKVNLKTPPNENQDTFRLNIFSHFANDRYAEGISQTVGLKGFNGKDSYWWSCLHSEPGIHRRSFGVSTQDYMGATEWIKKNISFEKGVIQPPYLPKFGMYSHHIGFWDPKLDQHMMYIVKGYYAKGLHRLRSVAGPNAWEFESGVKGKGLGPAGRWYFLDLTKEQIIKIHSDYPGYDYLLTENKNLQGYPVIYSNSSLALYDISEP